VKAVVQRGRQAKVSVEGKVVGQIPSGLVVLLGIAQGDSEQEARWMANKIANLRIFADQDGKFNRSILDVGGQALVVAQFTLYGDARKGPDLLLSHLIYLLCVFQPDYISIGVG